MKHYNNIIYFILDSVIAAKAMPDDNSLNIFKYIETICEKKQFNNTIYFDKNVHDESIENNMDKILKT